MRFPSDWNKQKSLRTLSSFFFGGGCYFLVFLPLLGKQRKRGKQKTTTLRIPSDGDNQTFHSTLCWLLFVLLCVVCYCWCVRVLFGAALFSVFFACYGWFMFLSVFVIWWCVYLLLFFPLLNKQAAKTT